MVVADLVDGVLIFIPSSLREWREWKLLFDVPVSGGQPEEMLY